MIIVNHICSCISKPQWFARTHVKDLDGRVKLTPDPRVAMGKMVGLSSMKVPLRTCGVLYSS